MEESSLRPLIPRSEVWYIVRDKKDGITAKGAKGPYGGSSIRKGKGGPKLYSIGAAKGIVTTYNNYEQYYGPHHKKDLEIVPVTVIYGEPINLENKS